MPVFNYLKNNLFKIKKQTHLDFFLGGGEALPLKK